MKVQNGTINLQDGATISYRIWEPMDQLLHKKKCNTVLAFNGAFCNRYLWENIGPIFAKNGITFVSHDVRGSGDSDPGINVNNKDQYTFDQYAKDAVQLMNMLHIQKAVVWGVAWGSRAALVFAVHHSIRCTALVLGDFSLGNSTTKTWSALQKMSLTLARSKISRMHIIEPKTKRNSRAFKHKSIKNCQKAMMATRKGIYRDTNSFMQFSLSNAHPWKILIMTGEFDPNLVALPGGSEDITDQLKKSGSHATLCVLPAAGHLAVRHRPLLCAEKALQFVLEIDSNSMSKL